MITNIAAAGLIAYGDGGEHLDTRAVPIETHPDAVGGGTGRAIDADELHLSTHDVGGFQESRRQEQQAIQVLTQATKAIHHRQPCHTERS